MDLLCGFRGKYKGRHSAFNPAPLTAAPFFSKSARKNTANSCGLLPTGSPPCAIRRARTSGVCTTCAARITEGAVHQPDAMGVKAELQEQGYALLCVAFPRSDLKVLAGQEDAQIGRAHV